MCFYGRLVHIISCREIGLRRGRRVKEICDTNVGLAAGDWTGASSMCSSWLICVLVGGPRTLARVFMAFRSCPGSIFYGRMFSDCPRDCKRIADCILIVRTVLM